MILSSSSGDFGGYTDIVADRVRGFKGTKFKYVNLEIGGPEFRYDDDEPWRKVIDDIGEAAAEVGVSFAQAHSPGVNAYDGGEERYQSAIRAVRRSIEACHILGIDRTVVHASWHKQFTLKDFYEKNKRFYSEFFDLMEKYNVKVMTENMDDVRFYPISTGIEERELIDYIDHPLMGGCWDTAHANINKKTAIVSQYESIIALGDKLFGLHIADNFGTSHHHTMPFAGIVNFDQIMQGLLDVDYKGPFNFEASYTLMHTEYPPYHRQPWVHNGETVTKLFNPPIELKKQAVDLLYDIGKHILSTYNCFEE